MVRTLLPHKLEHKDLPTLLELRFSRCEADVYPASDKPLVGIGPPPGTQISRRGRCCLTIGIGLLGVDLVLHAGRRSSSVVDGSFKSRFLGGLIRPRRHGPAGDIGYVVAAFFLAIRAIKVLSVSDPFLLCVESNILVNVPNAQLLLTVCVQVLLFRSVLECTAEVAYDEQWVGDFGLLG